MLALDIHGGHHLGLQRYRIAVGIGFGTPAFGDADHHYDKLAVHSL